MPLFYRFTHSTAPTVDDFKSHAERGLGRPKTVSEHEWDGVSLQLTLESARAFRQRQSEEVKARLGDFISELDLPDHAEVEQTGSDPNHYSVWASAADLHACVTVTVPAVPLPDVEGAQ